jgi:hypothetical protein
MKSFKQFIMEMDETSPDPKQPTKVGPNNAFPMDKRTQYNLNKAAKTIGVKFKLEPVNIK